MRRQDAVSVPHPYGKSERNSGETDDDAYAVTSNGHGIAKESSVVLGELATYFTDEFPRKRLFESADVNQDGKLTRDEYDESRGKIFDQRHDPDGDGVIPLEK